MRSPDARAAWLPRCLLPALAVLCAAAGASAQSEEFEEGGFGRNGFYVGVGASFGFPMGDWTQGDEGGMSQAANESAQQFANAIEDASGNLTILSITPVKIQANGLDLDATRFGLGGVVGYRISPLAALEVEGEWLANTGRSNFTITNGGDSGSAEVKDLWAVTANVRVYPFSGRFQPFGVFGIGLLNSHVDLNVLAPNVTTTATQDNNGTIPPPPTGESEIVLPAGFALVDTGGATIPKPPEDPPDSQPTFEDPTFEPLVQDETSLDGAFRAGLGMDVYLTESVAAEVKADYVFPFSDNGFVSTQYLSLRVGLLYRF